MQNTGAVTDRRTVGIGPRRGFEMVREIHSALSFRDNVADPKTPPVIAGLDPAIHLPESESSTTLETSLGF
jgi:hypothetical protein